MQCPPELESYLRFRTERAAELHRLWQYLDMEEVSVVSDAKQLSAHAEQLSVLAERLLPRATPVARCSYETTGAWNSLAPVVLSGRRGDWAAQAWGWDWWLANWPDELVVSKQRAPLFDEDQAVGFVEG